MRLSPLRNPLINNKHKHLVCFSQFISFIATISTVIATISTFIATISTPSTTSTASICDVMIGFFNEFFSKVIMYYFFFFSLQYKFMLILKVIFKHSLNGPQLKHFLVLVTLFLLDRVLNSQFRNFNHLIIAMPVIRKNKIKNNRN